VKSKLTLTIVAVTLALAAPAQAHSEMPWAFEGEWCGEGAPVPMDI
jgi:hypothetical protein